MIKRDLNAWMISSPVELARQQWDHHAGVIMGVLEPLLPIQFTFMACDDIAAGDLLQLLVAEFHLLQRSGLHYLVLLLTAKEIDGHSLFCLSLYRRTESVVVKTARLMYILCSASQVLHVALISLRSGK